MVKWYDRGLQNLWWEFDSLIPCSIRALKQLILLGFKALFILFVSKRNTKGTDSRKGKAVLISSMVGFSKMVHWKWSSSVNKRHAQKEVERLEKAESELKKCDQ